MTQHGRIIKGIGGFYEVQLDDAALVTCKARGRFRKEGRVPMIGDFVEVLPQNDGNWAIQQILPRKNALLRPPVSNIDQLVIVVSASAPKPDWLLVDKLILHAGLLSISPILVLNKLDEADDDLVNTFMQDYARAFPAFCISTVTEKGLDLLRTQLKNRVTCLAGQSAVGKSSLLNALMPDLQLAVGGLSRKTERGRHTTRHAELWPFLGGAIVDTPGFSLFETEAIEQSQLDACYPEFGDAPQRCRFRGCAHINEPDCAVKSLLESGRLSAGRYARYQTIYQEIQQRRRSQYD